MDWKVLITSLQEEPFFTESAEYQVREKAPNENILRLNSINTFCKKPNHYFEEVVFVKETRQVATFTKIIIKLYAKTMK